MHARQAGARFERQARGLAATAAVSVAAIGVLVLAGWAFDIVVLRNLHASFTPMAVNTAACFVLAGVSLWLQRRQDAGPTRLRIARACAAVVALVGAATLAGYLTGVNVAIDEWLVRGQGQAAQTIAPGRMAPATALSFLLSGAVLLRLDGPTTPGFSLARWLALPVSVIALFAVLGYLYGVPALYSVAGYTAMALHTALAFLLLSAGMIAARRDREWVRILSSERAAGSLARRLLPAAVLVPVTLGWAQLMGEQAGLSTTEFGVTLTTLSTVMLFTGLVWFTVLALDRSEVAQERERRDADERIGRLNADLDARVRARTADLFRSESRYRFLFDNLLNGYARCRMLFENGRPVNWTYLEVNPAFEALTGLKDVVGRPVTAVVPGILEAHPELLETYGRVARGGPPEAFEIHVKPLGVWLAVTAYHSADDDFVAVFEGISERKRAEESLRDSQARLQLATEASNIGPWDWNLTTNTVYYSPEWKRQIGYADAEIAGEFTEWERRLHPEDRDRIVAAARAYVADPAVGYDVEFRLRHKDGSYRWIHTRGALIHDAAGTPVRMLGCHVDITDQKQAILEREQLTRTMQIILESTGEGVYGIDAAGCCTFINRAGAEALGWRSEDLVGQEMHGLTHHTRADLSPYPPGECPIGQTRTAGTPGRVDGEVFWRRDGTSFPVGYSSYPIVEAGVVRGAVVTFADVTEKLELEGQLRQAQKLEALGQLTGGVAHDFNNLLTAILGYARLLEESIEATDPRRADATEIRNAGERAAHLTQQLLAFSRRQVLQPQTVDLNALVSQVAQMLRRLIGEHIALETRPGDALWTTRVDPGQVQQVIINLVVNARDAMPGGGALVIDTANETLDDETALAHGVTAGAYVVLGVSDTGAGMDDATLKRIFEPFFTTKPLGKGTGLGLSTVYGIVKQSGGFVRVDSRPGQGSAFRVYLPTANGHAPAEPGPGAADPRTHGTETILLVEDDPAVRGLASRMLERQGYRVIDVDGAARARAAADPSTPIDLLLTDVLMPGGSGPDLYRELSTARPALKVVFMSGYSDDSAAIRGPMEGHVFLQKPFGGGSLARKVREALDRT